MIKISKNEKGFSAVEVVLVVVIVALIGVVGWLVYKEHHKTNTVSATNTSSTKVVSTTKTSAQATNPYQGWKTGQLQYEQISYEYPSAWTLSGSSSTPTVQQSNGGDDGLIFYPGEDDYTLTSPNGNKVQLIAGPGSAFIPWQDLGTAITLNTLGSSYYVNFGTYNSGALPSGTLPSEACIASTTGTAGTADGHILSKNITYKDPTDSPPTSGSGSDGFCYVPKNPESAAAYMSDPDFLTAKLIFESLKYE